MSLTNFIASIAQVPVLGVVVDLLDRHPLLGSLAPIGAALMSWLELAEPVARFASTVVGLLVGILALLIHIDKARLRWVAIKHKRTHESHENTGR